MLHHYPWLDRGTSGRPSPDAREVGKKRAAISEEKSTHLLVKVQANGRLQEGRGPRGPGAGETKGFWARQCYHKSVRKDATRGQLLRTLPKSGVARKSAKKSVVATANRPDFRADRQPERQIAPSRRIPPLQVR